MFSHDPSFSGAYSQTQISRSQSALPDSIGGKISTTEIRKMYSPSFSHLSKRPELLGYHFKPTPFYIKWVHGYNHKVGVINLNDNGTNTAFYAASNFGILYNWGTNYMRILQGHRHMVTCIAADAQGKWLVTGDTGPENIIIIWNSKDMFPQRTIFSPHRNFKLAKLALSSDAKYLLTVAYAQKAQINWWIWSFGINEPHAKAEISIPKDGILDLKFNPFNTSQFVLITKNDMWIGCAQKIFLNERGLITETDAYHLKIRKPDKKLQAEVGRLTSFCFVENSGQIIVATNRGAVLLFGYTMEYSTNPDSSDIDNLKYIKTVKLDKFKINVIKTIDGVIVTGNNKGEIRFYDEQMMLLYWVHGFKVDSVRDLSFNISPREYAVYDPKCEDLECKCKCMKQVVEEYKSEGGDKPPSLLKKKVASDATKSGRPFLIRDFIICTHNEGIGFVNFIKETVQIILNYKISPALSTSVHPEKKLICVGYQDGIVDLLSYTQHTLKMRMDLRDYYKIVTPPKDDSIRGHFDVYKPQLSVTCLKYSPSGHHLACGLNTGQLIFLDPTTIDIITEKPFKDSKYAIKEISFSPDSQALAFSDQGKTVCVYKFNCETFEWSFKAKHRAHYKDITAVFFLPAKNPNGEYKLLSFGMDRVMVEYDIGNSSDEYLEVMSLDRMDQTAIPLAGIVWPVPENLDEEEFHVDLPTVLIANDEHKYKIINYDTTMTLATYLGPRFEHPVKQMILYTKENKETKTKKNYMLFSTKVVIGIQKMPLDGNPWKHVGMLGHPIQLITMCFREDSETLFTIGAKDSCMTQWLANPNAVDKTAVLGGWDLDPYYCLIENGRPGWLFQEVRDLFYYIQILCQGTFSPAMRRVKDFIPIDSLPDLMRALGFFPSEYEVENLLIEAKYKVYNKNPVAEIDFEEFVKLYLNHRPAFLFTYKKIRNAFNTFANVSKTEGEFMRRDEFIKALCNYGENFSHELAWYLLSILYGQSFESSATNSDDDFAFLPSKLKLSDITMTIMGIPDMDTTSEQQSNVFSVGSGNQSSNSSDSDEFQFY